MAATRGPQVVLEGYARDVARGGGGKTMRENIAAMDALQSAGLVADGSTVDGSSRTGGKAYDPVVAQFPHAPVPAWEVPAPLLNVSTASGGNLPLGGGTLTGDLVMTTGTRFALDTAAYGGVPNMYMYSLGGAVVFYADGWNEWTPSAFRGINFKVFGNGGADEYWGVTGGPNGTGSTLKAYSVSGGWPCIGSILASNEGQLMLGNDTGTILNIQGPTGQLTKNYIQLVGGGPGGNPNIKAVGEAGVDLSLSSASYGSIVMSDSNGTMAIVQDASQATGIPRTAYFTLTAPTGALSGTIALSTGGIASPPTAVSMALTSVGNGGVVMNNGNGPLLVVSDPQAASTPNAAYFRFTVPSAGGGAVIGLTAGSQANENMSLCALGTGAVVFCTAGSVAQARVLNTVSAVATVDIAGAVSGGSPQVRPSAGNLMLGGAGGVATNTTGNMIQIPYTSGTPTGTPTNAGAGATMVYDTSANRLWIYSGSAWRSAVFT